MTETSTIEQQVQRQIQQFLHVFNQIKQIEELTALHARSPPKKLTEEEKRTRDLIRRLSSTTSVKMPETSGEDQAKLQPEISLLDIQGLAFSGDKSRHRTLQHSLNSFDRNSKRQNFDMSTQFSPWVVTLLFCGCMALIFYRNHIERASEVEEELRRWEQRFEEKSKFMLHEKRKLEKQQWEETLKGSVPEFAKHLRESFIEEQVESLRSARLSISPTVQYQLEWFFPEIFNWTLSVETRKDKALALLALYQASPELWQSWGEKDQQVMETLLFGKLKFLNGMLNVTAQENIQELRLLRSAAVDGYNQAVSNSIYFKTRPKIEGAEINQTTLRVSKLVLAILVEEISFETKRKKLLRFVEIQEMDPCLVDFEGSPSLCVIL